MGKNEMIDVKIERAGSLFMFQPLTDAAKEWLKENVSEDSQWFGGRLVVEHRYAMDLAEGMKSEGMIVR